ncbi:MAG: ATP-binding cassette domain-containing protein [Fibrobacteria bacterium]|nr:ATP-binding cassette domain-containing protein [Fibrobacteria bacterium]
MNDQKVDAFLHSQFNSQFSNMSDSFISTFLKENKRAFLKTALLSLLIALLEASFILLLRSMAQSISAQTGESTITGISTKNLYLVFFCLALLVIFRAFTQLKQTLTSLLMLNLWITRKRETLLVNISRSSLPLYRHPQQFVQQTGEILSLIKAGALAWVNTLASSLQLLLFIPLLFLFPKALSITVLILLVPVIVISRFRIKILNTAGKNWLNSTENIKQSIDQFATRLESYTGNASLEKNSRLFQNFISTQELKSGRWEFLQAAFPQIMEMTFFFLITGTLAFMVNYRVGGSLDGWQVFPFVVLLLLMYKPVREWARLYPSVIMGKKAWQSHQEFRNRLQTPSLHSQKIFTGKELLLDNISFRYKKGLGSPQVFHNFSLRLLPGAITGIQGSNGAGKSTLLKLLAGLEMPDNGRIIFPESWSHIDYSALTSYLPQKALPELTLYNAVITPAETEQENALAPELCAILSLDPILKKLGITNGNAWQTDPKQLLNLNLSGGEQQRLCLARVFSSGSRYLLLDEPTTWLPGTTRVQTLKQLIAFWQKQDPTRGVLIATHEQDILEACEESLNLLSDHNGARYL